MAESKQSGQHRDNADTTLTRTYENPLMQALSATVESAVPSKKMTCNAKSNSCETSTLRRKSSRTLVADSIGKEKDLLPYWNDFTAEISSNLWLPTGIGLPTSDSSLLSGLSSETVVKSWFSVNRNTAPNRNSPRIFSPFPTPSVAGCMDYAGTKTQSKRIRLYPSREQKKLLRLWFDAARWCYNETIAWLKELGEDANWKKIKTPLIHSAPERLQPAPYQVRSIAVRDACRAMSMVKKRNKGKMRADGLAQASFRSRKSPKQSCYIPQSAVKVDGAYYTILGKLRMAEPLPDNHGDSRLTCQNGQYHLVVTHEVQRHEGETQARVVALDPGIRSFLTWFSEDDCGKIAHGAFGRIQRLCQHLDNLISRKAKTARKLRFERRNLQRAIDRMRWKISNLVDELHHQASRWLVDNYDIILIPSFETQDMVQRGKRKLTRKSVKNLLTLSHYRFREFLTWKAWQNGKAVVVVNEAYTSKTCSWSGEIIQNLGGRKTIVGSDGFRLDRDINGARGIFLRALGDSPTLRKLTQSASATDASSVCWRKGIGYHLPVK